MAREHASSALVHRLARHQERRRARIPTVSVLSGPVLAGVEVWRAWLAGEPRGGVECLDAPGPDLAASWLASLLVSRDLMADVLSALAREAPSALAPDASPAELGRRLGRMSSLDQAQFLQALLDHGAAAGSVALCRALRAATDRLARDRAWQVIHALEDVFGARDQALAARVVAAFAALVPEPALPGLLVGASPAWQEPSMSQVAAWAGELAAMAPALPLAIAAEAALVRDYLAHAVESRAKALVRQGLVECEDMLARDSALAAADSWAFELDPAFSRTHARLRLMHRSPELMAAFDHAAREYRALREPGEQETTATRASPASPAPAPAAPASRPAGASARGHEQAEPGDRARSAAERLLFRALESLPETTGLFALNQRLDIVFGSAPVEVDLLCQGLGIAVEVDGYYHFRDADAYRRDRRKDILLQLHRYLVVRCLADDVVVALDRVLDTILDAVVRRRAARAAPRVEPSTGVSE